MSSLYLLQAQEWTFVENQQGILFCIRQVSPAIQSLYTEYLFSSLC